MEIKKCPYSSLKVAQANYYGPDNPGFIYADTDSMYISGLKPEEIKGIEITEDLIRWAYRDCLVDEWNTRELGGK